MEKRGNTWKWYTHSVSPEEMTGNRGTCTSTGVMLGQIETSLPQALMFERYPKLHPTREFRDYPFSRHDNKHALKDTVTIFTEGVGRKKCNEDRRQHNSQINLRHEEASSGTREPAGNLTTYQSDFIEKEAVDSTIHTRRYPNNHKIRSEQAALALAEEEFMWFGRNDQDDYDTIEQLATTKS